MGLVVACSLQRLDDEVGSGLTTGADGQVHADADTVDDSDSARVWRSNTLGPHHAVALAVADLAGDGNGHFRRGALTRRDGQQAGRHRRPRAHVVAAVTLGRCEVTTIDLRRTGVELDRLGRIGRVHDLDPPGDCRALGDVVDDVDPGAWVVLAVDRRLEESDADRTRWGCRRLGLCG